MRKTKTKLSLRPETIRQLTGLQFHRVVGGESALCPTVAPHPGCCSTNYTYESQCATTGPTC